MKQNEINGKIQYLNGKHSLNIHCVRGWKRQQKKDNERSQRKLGETDKLITEKGRKMNQPRQRESIWN